MQKKLVFVSDTFYPDPNGVAVFLRIIIPELARNGFEVTVFTNSKAKNPFGDSAVKIVKLNAIDVPSYRNAWVCTPNPLSFAKLLVREKPDIIHFHSAFSPMNIMALAVAKYKKIPTVGTFHAFLDEYHSYMSIIRMPDLSGMYPKVISDSMKKLSLDKRIGMTYFKKKMIWKIMQAIFNKFDVVIAPSRLSAAKIRSNKIPCEVAFYAVDIQNFRKKNSYRKKNRILTVGRLGFEKKIGNLIKAMAILEDQNLILTIVGDGPARPSLELLARELGIFEKINFAGMVRRGRLQKFFESHDFFVNASDSETFGYVTAEAMAAGLPIVGVRSHGTADLVKDRVNGYLVNPDDVKALADAIRKMNSKSEASLAKMGKESRFLVRAFSIEKSVRAHVDIYNRLLKKGTGLQKCHPKPLFITK
ncbi:glycosyltransferase [Candidatus Woesearchaeota archaeon]|nr:glycosyltransferase [Candidatus Woesearchaeota archaeon]